MKILDGLIGFATSVKYVMQLNQESNTEDMWRVQRNALLFHNQKSLVWQSHEHWWFRQFAVVIFRRKEVPLCLAICVLEHG